MHAWEEFLQQQEAELGKETVEKWLRSLKIQRFDACNIYLEAKDSFQSLWFDEHVRSKAQTKLVNGNQKPIKVHIAIANKPIPSKKSRATKTNEKTVAPFHLSFDELDPLCNLPSFIAAPENQLIHKLFQEITAGSSVETFNPIYIYGSPGSGKTHLLMSLAKIYRSKGLRAIYARAETFTDHVVTAIRAGEMSLFRQTYRNADVLLIDDVHVFSRKAATQEEFFHTFNTLHLAGKQIILSAYCSPQELQLIEPRLVSRFEWGIVLPVQPLHTEDLIKMLQAKAQALNFPLPQLLQKFLVETFTSNPKALIKAFEALVLRLHLDSNHSIQGLSLTAAKMLLKDLLAEEQKSTITSSKIIQTIADHYGIRTEDILGKAQTRDCVLPRQLSMYLCRVKLKMPFMKIGEIFSRDHSTVMSSIKHIQNYLDEGHQELVGAQHAILKKLQA